jgi:hypothetical protein
MLIIIMCGNTVCAMILVMIYLSRAFDTISHEILFNKLYVYGIRGLALDWIKNYFQNWKQFVNYNVIGFVSDAEATKS